MNDEAMISQRDGTKIFVREVLPSGPARAVLVIAHGFKAHGGLYVSAAEAFARRGLAVYLIDHRGHGKSGGERYVVGTADDYVADLDQLVELSKVRHTGLPTFLLGHSAGGVIGCLYALSYQHKLAGFVCESFAFGVYAPNIALQLLKGVGRIAPRLPVLDLKNKLFSRDAAVVAALDTDPLIPQVKYPAHTVAALVRATERLRAEFERITLPVLIMHGVEDRATEPAGSQLFYDRAGSRDKTLKLYPQYVHDLLADTGWEVPLGDMAAWLDAHIVAHVSASGGDATAE